MTNIGIHSVLFSGEVSTQQHSLKGMPLKNM